MTLKNTDRTTPGTASSDDAGLSVDVEVYEQTTTGRVFMRLRNVVEELGRRAPNVKFVGRAEYDKGKRKILKPNDPIERFSDAGELFLLPPADFQKRRRLFYHESAARIAATFPTLYKLVRQRSK